MSDGTPILKLRFPEFNDEWRKEPLGNIYEQIRNGFVGTATPSYVASGHRYVQGKDIKNGTVQNTVDVFVSDEFHNTNKKSILRVNDIVMVQSGHVGECAVVNTELDGANCHALIVMSPSKPVKSAFYVHYFYSPKGKKLIHIIKTGNTIVHILASDMKRMLVPYCSLEEQEKIADFLSVVDNRLIASTRKLELLKKYKSGIMQKILTHQTYFKDENDNPYPAWELRKAGELFKNISNKTHKSDLSILSVTQEEGVVVRSSLSRKINQSVEGIKDYKVIEPNDFVISLRSFQGGIEMSRILGISSPAYTVIRGGESVYPEFYRHYFKRQQFISQLSSTVIGIRDGKQISYDSFAFLKLPVPSLKEQQKIADFLSTIDEKIKAEEAKSTTAKQFKKALLQRMFV